MARCSNWCCGRSYTWRCGLCSDMLVVIMDFKSFIIGLVVGIFGPYMDDLIRKKFLKSSEKKTEKSVKK
ncbi:bacteriocin BlpO [Streptococcus pneumoniae INV104]|nr:bacteriocin BlpO [Streptococcus pneumoniae INV104]